MAAAQIVPNAVFDWPSQPPAQGVATTIEFTQYAATDYRKSLMEPP